MGTAHDKATTTETCNLRFLIGVSSMKMVKSPSFKKVTNG